MPVYWSLGNRPSLRLMSIAELWSPPWLVTRIVGVHSVQLVGSLASNVSVGFPQSPDVGPPPQTSNYLFSSFRSEHDRLKVKERRYSLATIARRRYTKSSLLRNFVSCHEDAELPHCSAGGKEVPSSSLPPRGGGFPATAAPLCVYLATFLSLARLN